MALTQLPFGRHQDKPRRRVNGEEEMNTNAITDEPLDRLEQRAIDGVRHGIAALKRMLRTLPRWMRRGGELDPCKAVAAVAAVQTALTTLSPLHMAKVAKKVRRRMNKAA